MGLTIDDAFLSVYREAWPRLKRAGLPVTLFVATESGDPADAIIFINPEIEPFGPIVEMEEGCLSLPGTRALIHRPESVRITYTGLDGVQRGKEYGELMARIIQHEFDHLDGVLFFERMSETDRLRIKPELETLEKQYRP